MNIEQLIIPPKTIAIAATYQCTAACKNCCFGCNPTIKDRLSLQEMENYVDQAMEHYGNSVFVLALTGGECFLLGSDLVEIVEYRFIRNAIKRLL